MALKKKLETGKTIQLILTVLIAVACLVIIFTNHELYQTIGHNTSVRMLCILLWAMLLITFIFILIDFRSIANVARHYRELDYNVTNDHIAGIANRYSCDSIIEQYADKPLPSTVGCVMLEISNLRVINQTYGHTVGNSTIQAFSDILSSASVGLCFVGRNGGNKFMALFEDCNETKLNVFMNRVRQKVETHDLQPGVPSIEFRSGRAFNEGAEIGTITQLIALADRRIMGRSDTVTGIPNRDTCDEVIEQYLDKPLPPDVGCIMLDFTGLKTINEKRGRIVGNQALRRFSDMLREASRDLCFVGRNGGTRFMALFEECSREKLDSFIEQLMNKVSENNSNPENTDIVFSWGTAFEEPELTTINQLLACANNRIHDNSSDKA